MIQNFKALSSGVSIKERPASLSILSTVSISRAKPTPMATIVLTVGLLLNPFSALR